MAMTKLARMAMELNDHLQTTDDVKIVQLREEIAGEAMTIAGVTSRDLADENQENSPRIQLYWMCIANLWSKLHGLAGNDQFISRLDQ